MLKINEPKVHAALGENIMDRVITTIEAVEIFETLTPVQQEAVITYLRSLSEAEEDK